MSKTKFFRVAVEGDTVDGRVIERKWLMEASASYNRETYAARVNMEHIRGITADKPFKAYGDVLAVKAEEVEIELDGKTQKKLALFAEIAPTDDLIAINRDKQKLYTSIEINPNFAGTGKAYLVGLAVTDSPASLGTELLTFAVKHPGTLRHGPALQAEGNVFSLGLETSFELADGTQGDPVSGLSPEVKSFFSAATGFFNRFKGDDKPADPPKPANDPAPANDNDARFAAIAAGMEQLTKGFEAGLTGMTANFTSQFAAVNDRVTTLSTTIENTDASQKKRPPAAGGGAQFATDC